MDWRDEDGVRWLEASLPGAKAAFSTRVGGVSQGSFASLNLGLLSGDALPDVRENRLRLARTLGRTPEGFLIGYQVHGAAVLSRDTAPVPNPYADPGPAPPSADGQATTDPALTPLVQVADCLPVAVAGERGVAILHCGWRGLAAGIVERGVGEVGAAAAAVGPGIGPCCYEVGPEVLEAFAPLGKGIATDRMLDLPQVARRLLERAGVAEVEVSGLCTHCDSDLFFSHRRDGERSGRQAGLVWMDNGG